MSEATAILLTLIGYKLALIAIGWVSNRKTHSEADFFLGGRQLGPWVAALSASASSASAWALLGVSGAAYAWGLSAIWLFPACVGGFALNWYVVAPRLRPHAERLNALTLTDVLAHGTTGSSARIIRVSATAIILVSLMAYVASQFQGAGKMFAETFEMPNTSSILLGSGIVVLYTMLGGFWAVSITDTLQGAMMVAASVLLPTAALVAVGGPAELLHAMDTVDVPGYASVVQELGLAAGVGFALGLLGIGLGYPGQPHVVCRFMALRDDAGVNVGRKVALGWAVITYAGMLLTGWCARVLLGDLPDHEAAFIGLTRDLFPPIVAGVILAAVLSAIMSTADSQLLVAASSVTHDLKPAGRAFGEGTMVRNSRLMVLGLSAAAIVAALYGNTTIFAQVLFAWTAMGAAFGPLLIVLLLGRRVSGRTRIVAIWVGCATAITAYLYPPTSGTAWERVVPFGLALAIALLGGRRSTSQRS